ncbi:hypothetical protein ACIA8G_05300 [Lentzea sp. NPDC051213]|uniref:hypothetical protein n=1 Tax=Lentzea sp. NPDC051213 TaxID=3364126 RepID=UPI0037AC6FE9
MKYRYSTSIGLCAGALLGTFVAAGTAEAAAPDCAVVKHEAATASQSLTVTNRCTYQVHFRIRTAESLTGCKTLNPGGITTYRWPLKDAYQGIEWNCNQR